MNPKQTPLPRKRAFRSFSPYLAQPFILSYPRGMDSMSFSARVGSWLNDIKPGLGMHASVIIAYGATSHDDNG